MSPISSTQLSPLAQLILSISVAILLALLIGVGLARLAGREKRAGERRVKFPAVLIAPLLAICVAYSTARWPLPGHETRNNLVTLLLLASLCSLPTAVALCRCIGSRVSKGTREAAMLDGASALQFYWHIVLPVIWRRLLAAVFGIAATVLAAIVIIAPTMMVSGLGDGAPLTILNLITAHLIALSLLAIALALFSLTARSLDDSRFANVQALEQ